METQERTPTRMSITPVLSDARLRTDAAPAPAPVRPLVSRLRLAFLSGVLLWLCYFPAACGWLAWVALVPLLLLVRSQSRARAVYFTAYAAGLLFYVPALQWM